jgi:Polysaccharide lyase/Stigma-specific protein, Stig1
MSGESRRSCTALRQRRSRSRVLVIRALIAAVLVVPSASALAQVTTYQAPSSLTTYPVYGAYSATAFDYTVPSGSPYYSAYRTVFWDVVDSNQTATVSTVQFNGQPGYYLFDLQDGTDNSCSYWDSLSNPGTCNPRVEFDSASPTVQNSPTPDGGGWSAGIITPGLTQVFQWSMYLDPSFPLDQGWCTLFQFHSGNVNYQGGSRPGEGWPSVKCNNNTVSFGLGLDSSYPGELWYESVSNLRGHWVDLFLYAHWSTGSDGLLELWVNGVRKGHKNGPNFYDSTNGQPFYYVKQGYYRARSVTVPGLVYMTPVVVSFPVASCSSGTSYCNGACVDVYSNSSNCGACGLSCAGGTCSNAVCSCPAGTTNCNGTCVNTATDNNNCGACGNVCSYPNACSNGACIPLSCPPATPTNCNGTCVDLDSNSQNCGACGNACGSSKHCDDGLCCLSGYYNCCGDGMCHGSTWCQKYCW